jgi:chromosome segregation ATPase
MSVEFSNTYQEILLENLVAIIKQNFIFQTQIKLAENFSKESQDVKKKLEELTTLYNTAKAELSQLSVYKNKAESNSSAHEEKNRIQAALNDAMKKNSSIQKELDEKNNEINKLKDQSEKEIVELKNYIFQLESIAPVTKLKKINPEKTITKEDTVKVLPVFEEKNDSTKIENKLQKVLDGSTF